MYWGGAYIRIGFGTILGFRYSLGGEGVELTLCGKKGTTVMIKQCFQSIFTFCFHSILQNIQSSPMKQYNRYSHFVEENSLEVRALMKTQFSDQMGYSDCSILFKKNHCLKKIIKSLFWPIHCTLKLDPQVPTNCLGRWV